MACHTTCRESTMSSKSYKNHFYLGDANLLRPVPKSAAEERSSRDSGLSRSRARQKSAVSMASSDVRFVSSLSNKCCRACNTKRWQKQKMQRCWDAKAPQKIVTTAPWPTLSCPPMLAPTRAGAPQGQRDYCSTQYNPRSCARCHL